MKYEVLTEIIASKHSILWVIALLALLGACQGNTSRGAGDNTKPEIQITEVPSRGAGQDRLERIAGTVRGVNI